MIITLVVAQCFSSQNRGVNSFQSEFFSVEFFEFSKILFVGLIIHFLMSDGSCCCVMVAPIIIKQGWAINCYCFFGRS